MTIALITSVFLLADFSHAGAFPRDVREYYGCRQTIYWKIRQISISPIFDEPETSLVQFYSSPPETIFITMPDRQIYSTADTLWIYMVGHKQIQKSAGRHLFSPYDFIDSAQTFYRVVAAKNGTMTLKSVDESMEPDSLTVHYAKNGAIRKVEYMDLNDNRVVFEFLEESFSRLIPEDNFLDNIPEGVEMIDLSD